MNATEARQWGAIYGALMALDAAALPSVSFTRKQSLGSRIGSSVRQGAKKVASSFGGPAPSSRSLLPSSSSYNPRSPGARSEVSSAPSRHFGGNRSVKTFTPSRPRVQSSSMTVSAPSRHFGGKRSVKTLTHGPGLFPKSGNDAAAWSESKHPRKGGKFVSKGGKKRPSGSGRFTGPRHPKFEAMLGNPLTHLQGPLSGLLNLATYPATHAAKKSKQWNQIAQQIKDNSEIKNGVLQLTHPMPRQRKRNKA